MKEEISICKQLGVYGVVFGILTKENEIDYRRCRELVELSAGMQITFHKAIDLIDDPVSAVVKLGELGVQRILTSGTHKTAYEGKEILNRMIEVSDGNPIIVVAGKVTDQNLNELSSAIAANEFHGKLIVGKIKD